MPVYDLGYRGYEGTDPVVDFFDTIANHLFSWFVLERVPFFFLMLLLIALGQALFERKRRSLHYTGLFFLIFLCYLLTSFLLWAFDVAEGIWYYDYILIGDLVLVIFIYVFIAFSIIRIKKHMFSRYFWPYLVSFITLIVEIFLYGFMYKFEDQIFSAFIVLALMFVIWVLLKKPPIRSRSLTSV